MEQTDLWGLRCDSGELAKKCLIRVNDHVNTNCGTRGNWPGLVLNFLQVSMKKQRWVNFSIKEIMIAKSNM